MSSSSPAGAEVALRMQIDAICDGDPDCEEDIVVNGEGAEGAEGADELLLEPRPGRGGSSYYFRTRKDGLEVRRTLFAFLATAVLSRRLLAHSDTPP